MNVFGIQCQFDSGEAERYNREVKPTMVMGINVVKIEWWRRIRADNPDGWRAYRQHEDPRFDDCATPEESAERAVAMLKGKLGHLLAEGLITHATDGNEDIEAKHHDLHHLRDRYGAAFVPLARSELGVGTLAGNFSCGHFAGETVDIFPLTLQAIEEDNRAHPENPSAAAFHEYDWPTLDRIFEESGDHWLCGKFLKAMPPVLERFPNVKCAITEFGVDSGVAVEGEHRGWRKAFPDLAEAVEVLCGERGLEWYYPLTEVPYLMAVLLFGCGMGSDWRGRGFDIMENVEDTAVMDRVKLFPGWEPPSPELPPEPPPEPEPPEEGEMDIKVIDLGYNERDFEYAEKKYGVAFRRAEVAPGQKVYRLVELWEKSGPASLVTQVLNEDGSPMPDVDVAFYWPDAPDPPDPPTEVYPHDWHRNFVHGLTGGNGDVGPGMGPGAYIDDVAEGGPHAVWIRDPDIPTDICERLGMLPGTFHDHLDQKFKLMTADGEEEPEPGKKRFVKAGDAVWTPGPHNYIRVVAADHNLMDMRGNLRSGGWEIPEPVHPKEMDGKAGLEFDCTYTEDEDRVYVASIFHLPTGEVLGGPWLFPFEAGETGVWQVTVEWREPGEPPPSPPPVEPPEEAAAVYRMMAAAHGAIAHHNEVLRGCWEKLAELAGLAVGR